MSGNPFLEFLATARCRHSDPPVTPWCEWPVVPRPPRAWSVLAWHGKRRMCRGWTIHGVFTGDIPSGKHTKNYGKSPCFMGKITISMAIFNSELLNYQRVNGYHGRRNRKFRDMGMEWDLHSNLFEFAMENGPFVVMIYRRWWWPRKVDVLPVKNECFPYSFVVFSAHKNWDLVEIILYIYTSYLGVNSRVRDGLWSILICLWRRNTSLVEICHIHWFAIVISHVI